jgi:hypothetical protein
MTGKTSRQTTRRHIASSRRLVEFFPMKGKILEGVEFSTSIEDHSITLRFEDKTQLRLEIEPGFTLFADYSNWKTGNLRPLKRWPRVRSQSMRG